MIKIEEDDDDKLDIRQIGSNVDIIIDNQKSLCPKDIEVCCKPRKIIPDRPKIDNPTGIDKDANPEP